MAGAVFGERRHAIVLARRQTDADRQRALPQDLLWLRDPPRASRRSRPGGGRAPHRRRGPCSCFPPGRRRAQSCCCSATRSPGSARPGPNTARGRRPSSARGRAPSACRRTFRGRAVEQAAGIPWWRRGWPRRRRAWRGRWSPHAARRGRSGPGRRGRARRVASSERNGVPAGGRGASTSYDLWSAIS